MQTAIELWEVLPNKDRRSLMEIYNSKLLVCEYFKPTNQEILDILLKAKNDKYLLTPFTEWAERN